MMAEGWNHLTVSPLVCLMVILVVGWNTYTGPLHMISLMGLVWVSSQHGGWIPIGTSQENRWKLYYL